MLALITANLAMYISKRGSGVPVIGKQVNDALLARTFAPIRRHRRSLQTAS
jgi:hypothetical protein